MPPPLSLPELPNPPGCFPKPDECPSEASRGLDVEEGVLPASGWLLSAHRKKLQLPPWHL